MYIVSTPAFFVNFVNCVHVHVPDMVPVVFPDAETHAIRRSPDAGVPVGPA